MGDCLAMVEIGDARSEIAAEMALADRAAMGLRVLSNPDAGFAAGSQYFWEIKSTA
jgi:hypothetical protein